MKTLPILLGAAAALILSSTAKKDQNNTNQGPTGETSGQGETGANVGQLDRRSSNYNLRSANFKAFIENQINSGLNFDQAFDNAWKLWNSPENKLSPLIPTKQAFYSRLYHNKTKIHNIGANIINWDSQPLYDNFDAYWNGDPVWSCAEWILWHNKLEQHYGSTQQANQIWVQAWESSEHDPDCWAFFCPDTSYCRYDCTGFVNYLESKNIPVGNLFSNVTCNLANVVTNTTEGIEFTSKILRYAIPAIALYAGYRYLENRNII
jgi:hypothetical protein